MGSLVLEKHWSLIVLASVREFFHAEDYTAGLGKAEGAEAAAYEALRRGMIAAIFLHHFSEVALNRKLDILQTMKTKKEIYAKLAERTVGLDGQARPYDAKILGEVADAVKHAELTASHIEHVEKNGRVIEWAHDAKGIPYVSVPTHNGPRALRELLLNICNTWSDWAGLPHAVQK